MIATIIVYLTRPNRALAAITGTLKVNNSDTSIGELIVRIISYVAPVLGGIALAFIIYGGILFITSEGNPDKLTKAKSTLFWAIIGILLIVLAYVIVIIFKRVLENNIF